MAGRGNKSERSEEEAMARDLSRAYRLIMSWPKREQSSAERLDLTDPPEMPYLDDVPRAQRES